MQGSLGAHKWAFGQLKREPATVWPTAIFAAAPGPDRRSAADGRAFLRGTERIPAFRSSGGVCVLSRGARPLELPCRRPSRANVLSAMICSCAGHVGSLGWRVRRTAPVLDTVLSLNTGELPMLSRCWGSFPQKPGSGELLVGDRSRFDAFECRRPQG